MTDPQGQSINPMFQLLTIFLSGVFGLLVAVVSNWMVSSKESRQHKREKAQAHYEEVKALYSEHLATLHSITTHTTHHLNEAPLMIEYASQDAKLALLSVPSVIEQADLLIAIIQRWAQEYVAGNPKGMIIGHGKEHRKAADELSDEIIRERAKLIEVMRAHMDALRASI